MHITLELPTDTIRACDPLLLRVRFENRSENVMIFDGSFPDQFRAGNLFLELRKRGEKDFRRIVMTDITPLRIPIPVEIRPGETFVGHEMIFRTGSVAYQTENGFMIPADGEYEIRVRIIINESVAMSPVVALRVTPISQQQLELMRSYTVSELCTATPAGWISHTHLDYDIKKTAAAKIVQELGDCYARTTIRWKLALSYLRTAKTPDELKQTETRWQEVRATLDPVTGEIADLMYANELHRRKDYSGSLRVLKTIESRSHLRDHLEKLGNMGLNPQPEPPQPKGTSGSRKKQPPQEDPS